MSNESKKLAEKAQGLTKALLALADKMKEAAE